MNTYRSRRLQDFTVEYSRNSRRMRARPLIQLRLLFKVNLQVRRSNSKYSRRNLKNAPIPTGIVLIIFARTNNRNFSGILLIASRVQFTVRSSGWSIYIGTRSDLANLFVQANTTISPALKRLIPFGTEECTILDNYHKMVPLGHEHSDAADHETCRVLLLLPYQSGSVRFCTY